MKKSLKKLMSVFMSTTCMISATAMNSNALMPAFNPPESYDRLLSGYTEFDAHNLFENDGDGGKMKHFTNGKKNEFLCVKYYDNELYLKISGNADIEAVKTVFHSYNPKLVVTDEKQENAVSRSFSIKDPDNNHSETSKYLKNILKDLKEITDVYEFDYWGGLASSGVAKLPYNAEDVTDYMNVTYENVESLKKYVTENNLDFTVETEVKIYNNSMFPEGKTDEEIKIYRCHLIPNNEITLDEHFEIANNIKNALGICIGASGAYGGASFYNLSNESLDILNSVDGDANEDGDMNIADATAIVQAIGNPDKYKLTTQGEFNADVDGNGLTGLDAVAIQIKLTSK